MGKYNWNFYTLEDRFFKLKRLIAKETNPEKLALLKSDYELLNLLIENNYYPENNDNLKLLESFKEIKNDLIHYQFTWKDIKKFYNITKDNELDFFSLKQLSLSKETLLTITHDFYKSLDHQYYQYFLNFFHNTNTHITFKAAHLDEDYSGESIMLPSINEYFVKIERIFTIEDIITTIHEYSHLISSKINYNHILPAKNLLSEIDSLFMELIASDYLENLFKNDEANIAKIINHESYISTSEIFNDLFKLITIEKNLISGYQSNKTLKQFALSKCSLQPLELEGLINNYNTNSITYLTSYLFAIELYNLYKTDQEKAIYYLKKIILLICNDEKEYYDNIKKLGIIPNQTIQSFNNEINNEILKLNLKKQNHF